MKLLILIYCISVVAVIYYNKQANKKLKKVLEDTL